MVEYLIKKLQNEYPEITKIEREDDALIIYAGDDILWKILKDLRDGFNMEFEASSGEEHFIRVLV
jgi:hypothetical protein